MRKQRRNWRLRWAFLGKHLENECDMVREERERIEPMMDLGHLGGLISVELPGPSDIYVEGNGSHCLVLPKPGLPQKWDM